MGKVVGVRFRDGGKIYNFDRGNLVVSPGDKVLVKTEQGLGLGAVVTPARMVSPEAEAGLKKILRLANEDDLWQHEKNLAREKYAFEYCLERIKARIMDMKLVSTEVLFDGSKIIFYYTAEGRVDFRALVKDLVGKFRTRIEMRQIGVRHEAKMVGGLGCCGRELCCASFLNEFAPVSVKMAKEQNLSLNPTKISGVCGRLMCCLTYEYKVYCEHKRGMPRMGKKVQTPEGEGKVIRQNIMERISTVILENGEEYDLEHGQLPPKPPRLPNQPEPEEFECSDEDERLPDDAGLLEEPCSEEDVCPEEDDCLPEAPCLIEEPCSEEDVCPEEDECSPEAPCLIEEFCSEEEECLPEDECLIDEPCSAEEECPGKCGCQPATPCFLDEPCSDEEACPEDDERADEAAPEELETAESADEATVAGEEEKE